MLNLFANSIETINTGHGSSYLSLLFGIMLFTIIKSLLSKLFNFILAMMWYIIKFVLGIMEAFEYIVNNFLGIGMSADDYVETAQSIKINGGSNLLDYVLRIFRAVAIVAIVLMIVFTIIAIIKQEYDTIQNGKLTPEQNHKGRILMRLFTNFMTIVLIPITFYVIIGGTNSILTAFSNALKGESGNVTVAGQVLASATYDANKYRQYAQNNRRVPILIRHYDASEYGPDEVSKLTKYIQKDQIQKKLKNTALRFSGAGDVSFWKFDEALTYQNNRVSNSADYDEYEKFVCTQEQYYIMADFIDYCQLNNIDFYIKCIDEKDIEWKYVDRSVYFIDSTGNVNLEITYKDADSIYSSSEDVASAAASASNANYTITYSTMNNVSSPISDALETISALLGVGEHADETYNVMERDSSGDFTNLVSWSNEKALLKFSSTFNVDDSTTWTDTDQIIFYEYNHFSSNNTFHNYTLDQLKDKGALLDVKKINYREYNATVGSYSSEYTLYCVHINGSYYEVEKSKIPSETDDFGSPYYVLKSYGTDVKFLDPGKITITKLGTQFNLKTSVDFNLNNMTNWTLGDAIIVYEYYKDLSVFNELNKYNFSKFSSTGVNVDVYEITKNYFTYSGVSATSHTETGYYISLNGTYYQLDSSKSHFMLPNGNPDSGTAGSASLFLKNALTETFTLYNYYVTGDLSKYGIPYVSGSINLDKLLKRTTDNNVDTELETINIPEDGQVDSLDPNYRKYSNIDLKISSRFDYKNIDSWTIRDYVIYYLYLKYGISSTIDSLQYNGIQGSIIKASNSKYYLRFKTKNQLPSSLASAIYLDLDAFNMVSQLNLMESLVVDTTFEDISIDTYDGTLFVDYSSDVDKLVASKTEYKTFYLSMDFDLYNSSTWTVGDYILVYLSELNKINDLSTIEKYGYTSLVYQTDDDKLYRFGKCEADGSGAYYLSQNNIVNKNLYKNAFSSPEEEVYYSSIDEWLNENLIKFVMSYYGTGLYGDLLKNQSQLISNINRDYNGYIYKYNDLLSKLVEDSNEKLFNNITKYTYKNTNLSANDLSTWNVMDYVIYQITGSIKRTYSSYILQDNTSNIKYFIVENYALDISTPSSPFYSTIVENTNITSTIEDTFNTEAALTQKYNSFVLLGEVISAETMLGAVKNTEVNYIYSSNYKLNSLLLPAGTQYTALDVILMKNLKSFVDVEDPLDHKYKYNFNVYSYNYNNYIKIGDVFVRLTLDSLTEEGQYYVAIYNPSNTIILNDLTTLFEIDESSGNYTSFVGFSEPIDSNVDFSKITKLDSIIYSLTSNLESTEYTIYKNRSGVDDGIRYIIVGSNYIKFQNTDKQISFSIIDDIKTKFTSENNDKLLEYIYMNYYKEFVLKSNPEVKNTSQDVIYQGFYIENKAFKLNDITTWDPIKIILYANNMVNDGFSLLLEDCTVFESPEGDIKYLKVITTENNGLQKEIFIDITSIAEIKEITGPDNKIISYVIPQQEATMGLYYYFNMLDNSGSEVINELNSHFAISQEPTSYLSYNTYCKTSGSIDKIQINNTFNEDNPTTWKWLDLVYYNLNNKFRSGTTSYECYLISGQKYIKVSDGSSIKYISLDEAVSTISVGSDIHVDAYNPDAEFNVLSMIIAKLTESNEEKYINTYEINNFSFMYLKNSSNENVAIYDLPMVSYTVNSKIIDETIINANIETKFGSYSSLYNSLNNLSSSTYRYYGTFSYSANYDFDGTNYSKLTYIDLALAYKGLLSIKDYQFDVYKNGSNYYIKITDDFYIKTSIDDNTKNITCNSISIQDSGLSFKKYYYNTDHYEPSLDSSNSYSQFYYLIKDESNVKDWEVLDIILHFANNSTDSKYFTSYVYSINGRDYVAVGDYNYVYVNTYSNLTYLDLIINNSTNSISRMAYSFEVLSNGLNNYIKINNNYYVKVGTNFTINVGDNSIISTVIDANISNLMSAYNSYILDSYYETSIDVGTYSSIGNYVYNANFSYVGNIESQFEIRNYIDISNKDITFDYDIDKSLHTLYSNGKVLDIISGKNQILSYENLPIFSKTSIANKNAEINASITNASQIIPEVVEFSDVFDVSNINTWSVSDFMLYYAFLKNYKSNFSVEFQYTYTPSYSYNSNYYTGITYFDLVLYKINGGIAKTDYSFYVYIDGTNYYIKIPSNVSENYWYIKIDENISIDESLRTISSTTLPKRFYKDAEIDELIDLADVMIGNTADNEVYKLDTLSADAKILNYEYLYENFQSFVNTNGAPGYVYYYIKTDNYGGVEVHKVFNLGSKSNQLLKLPVNDRLFDYDVFLELYKRRLVNATVTSTNFATMNVTSENEIKDESDNVISLLDYKETSNSTELRFAVKTGEIKIDFKYDDYYFFNVKNYVLNIFGLNNNIDQRLIDSIIQRTATIGGSINLKLSDGFVVTNTETWNILDYIIVYEFSREDLRKNKFYGLEFTELSKSDFEFYANLYNKNQDSENFLILELNGNYYNLTDYIELDGVDSGIYKMKATSNYTTVGDNTYYVSNNSNQANSIVTVGSVANYSFRTLYQQKKFILNENYVDSREFKIPTGASTISYTDDDNKIYLKSLYSNTTSVYQIQLARFSKYSIENYIKQVSWVEKLMTDMQVLYPDLNWSTLIATDGWLDTLGEYTSAYASGIYKTEGNSSNTTAAGLVLSELFLSIAKEESEGYAAYTYNSLFDEDTIRALMLSLMGEKSYTNLTYQAKIFMEFYNTVFAKIVDDIAYEYDIELSEGQTDSLVMCVYKSYLATLLLSSDIGEYLYTIATRVYAQYTIQESLAIASNDYARYYAYVSGDTDENGDVVDSFNYASFNDLVRYENKNAGNSQATFTFNFRKVYKYYNNGIEPSSNDIKDNGVLYRLVGLLDSDYSSIYTTGGVVADDDDRFCYLLHVYWSIVQEVGGTNKVAAYINTFHKYILGDLDRWSIYYDQSISGADLYFPQQSSLRTERTLYKISAGVSIIKLLLPQVYTDTSDMEGFQKFLANINPFNDKTVFSPLNVAETCLASGSCKNDVKVIQNSFLSLTFDMAISEGDSLSAQLLKLLDKLIPGYSMPTNVEAWNKILILLNSTQRVLGEFEEMLDLQAGDKTENGSTRPAKWGNVEFTDELINRIITTMSKFSNALESYVDAQKTLDKVEKASITYTLAQFGQNYVTTGYHFNIKNRDYVFDANISASRFGEYVYGGSYLESVGVEPVYTSSNFNGIVSRSKVYDSLTNTLKINLGMWTELRQFASNIASYTAKLYYQTNLKNLSPNISNGVKLTDYVYSPVAYGYSTPMNEANLVTTQEYVILRYLIENAATSENDNGIPIDTFVRLILGDSEGILNAMTDITIDGTGLVNNSMKLLAKSVSGNLGTGESPPSGQITKQCMLNYLALIQQEGYRGYYDASGTSVSVKDRIHRVFCNVMKYLMVSQDASGGEVIKNKLNLEDITFEEFKVILMEKIITYEPNELETSNENASRYLALFNSFSCQFNYYYSTYDDSNYIGTIVNPKTIVQGNVESPGIGYLSDGKIFVEYRLNYSTQQVVLRLANALDRPIEDLVNLEYGDDFVRTNYDESYHDVFVICQYDRISGMYVPFLMRSKTEYTDLEDRYSDYLENGFNTLSTNYYDSGVYPVVAKGIITADGYPTAIKKNTDGVIFYRTNIAATSDFGEDAVSTSLGVSNVTTVGYTKFQESTSYVKSGSSNTRLFTGSSNINQFVTSDVVVFYLQTEIEYNLGALDDFGAFNVLEDFSAFYLLNGQSYMLLIMSFMIFIPIMFNATLAVMRRILDLMFLIIVSPLVISLRSISPTGESKSFNDWKGMLEGTLLSCLGFIVAFNIYYILIPSVLSVSEFVSAATIAKIENIGGLSFINSSIVNALVRSLWVLAAVNVIEGAPKLLTPIITSGRVQNAYAPAVGGGKDDMVSRVKSLTNDLKEIAGKVKYFVGGQALLDIKDAAVEQAKAMIPGSAVVGAINDLRHASKNKSKGKELTESLIAKGTSPEEAKKQGKQLEEKLNKERNKKKQDRAKNAQRFMKNIM